MESQEKNTEIGVITEVGDLGLGYDPLTKEDQKNYKKLNKEKEEEKKDTTK